MNRHDETVKFGAALLLLCYLVRALAYLAYDPLVTNDTAGYRAVAQSFQRGDFSEHTGLRTPGYPLFLLLCGLDERAIWIAQMGLGIGTSLLLFGLGLRMTRSPQWAFATGLAATWPMNSLLLEAAQLTETLATFLLVLLVVVAITALHKKSLWWPLALGLLAGMSTLTRPPMGFLIPLGALAFVLRRQWRHAACFLTPAATLVLSWCLFNQVQLGTFSLTTTIGMNLTNHSGAFMDDAPEGDRDISEIYLRHRRTQVANVGTQSMTIFRALPEMQASLGLSLPELSQRLTRLSVRLILDHPLQYAQSVARAWLEFWAVRDYWEPTLITSPTARRVAQGLWSAEKPALRLLNLLFVLLGALIAGAVVRRKAVAPATLLVLVIVGCGALFQALLESGENSRYAIPFQPLVIAFVLAEAHCWRFPERAQSHSPLTPTTPFARATPAV
jgi:4-amino-4-deoxy-L-arabinose transferase-like glycosyltransferase